MFALLALIPSKLKMYLAIAGGVVLAIGIAFLKGYGAAKSHAKLQTAKAKADYMEKDAKLKEKYAKIATNRPSDDELEKRMENGKF